MQLIKYSASELNYLVTKYDDKVNYPLASKELCLRYNASYIVAVSYDPIFIKVFNSNGETEVFNSEALAVTFMYCREKMIVYNYAKILTDNDSYSINYENDSVIIDYNNVEIYHSLKNQVINNFKYDLFLGKNGNEEHIIIVSSNCESLEKYAKDFLKQYDIKYISFVNVFNNGLIEILTYKDDKQLPTCGSANAISLYLLDEYNILKKGNIVNPSGIFDYQITFYPEISYKVTKVSEINV